VNAARVDTYQKVIYFCIYFTCLCISLFIRYYFVIVSGNGPSVIARWTNNKYYSGKIVEQSNDQIPVMFDDGDKITHSAHDISAVFADKAPDQMQVAQHVVARWKGSKKYHIGFVTAKTSDGYEVTFDDGDYDTYTLSQLRIFPDHTSPHNGKWETEVLIHVPGTYTIPNNSIFEAVRPCAQLGVFKSLLLESLERFSIVWKVIRVLLWFYFYYFAL